MHKGQKHSPESIEIMRLAHKGLTGGLFEKGHKTNIGRKLSEETKRILSLQKIGNTNMPTGSRNHAWKGGITPLNAKIRGSKEYVAWRKSVFERDNYTCQMCKVRGGYLEADHIKPFAFFPSLRLELSNGRTLCKPCHGKTDTYGHRALSFK